MSKGPDDGNEPSLYQGLELGIDGAGTEALSRPVTLEGNGHPTGRNSGPGSIGVAARRQREATHAQIADPVEPTGKWQKRADLVRIAAIINGAGAKAECLA